MTADSLVLLIVPGKAEIRYATLFDVMQLLKTKHDYQIANPCLTDKYHLRTACLQYKTDKPDDSRIRERC